MRTAFSWLVATAAAAAPVAAPYAALVLGFGDSRAARVIAGAVVLASVGAVCLLVRVRPEPNNTVLGPLVGGTLGVWVLAAVAITVAYASSGSTGSCGSEPADTIGWIGFLFVYLGLGAWSLRAGRRAYWGLPLAFALGAAWLIGLAAAYPGPGGCGD